MTTETSAFEILLAEDNSADVALVRRALKEHGIQCVLHVIQDGAQAIQWIGNLDADPKASQLDLVLLDMHLPKRHGEDILKRLRSTERYAQTPVIMMTSASTSRIEEIATKHAAVVYFVKPSSLEKFMQLGAIVQLVLSGRYPDLDDVVGSTRGAA